MGREGRVVAFEAAQQLINPAAAVDTGDSQAVVIAFDTSIRRMASLGYEASLRRPEAEGIVYLIGVDLNPLVAEADSSCP